MSDQLTFFEPDRRQFTSIQQRFEEFDRLNPWVYGRLVKMARELRSKGVKHFGIKMLFETIRWEFFNQTADPHSRWKLDNCYTSRYARLIHQKEPDLAKVFELRKLTAD